MRFLRWLFDRFLGTTASLLIILALGEGVALAATSWNVHNTPQMFLNAGITTTQTSGITIAPLKRNGVTVTFPTTTGAVLRIRQGSLVEDIHFESATVNQSTKVVTLVNVTRDVCWNIDTRFISCNGGKAFSKGAIVELSTDARLFNLKANTDRSNTFIAPQTFGSGITLSGISHALRVTQVTTAQRNAIANPQNGMIVYNNTTGAMNQYIGGSWTDFATGTTPSAGFSTAGKVELADISELLGRRSTGATLALLAINPTHLTMSGGSLKHGFLAQVGTGGSLISGIGGTGVTSPASGGLLITQGSSPFKLLRPTVGTESGAVALWDGNEVKIGRNGQCRVVYNSVSDSNTVGTSTTNTEYFNKNYRIASGSYAIGDEWKIEALFDDFGTGAADGKVSLHWAGAFLSGTTANANADRYITAGFTVRSLGATGSVMPFFQSVGNDVDANNALIGIAGPKGINTASGAVINLAFTNSASDANNSVRLRTFKVTQCSPLISN